MRVVAINDESTQVRSFTLKPVQGDAPAFKPGQYVSVAVDLPTGVRQLRQYSMSDAPSPRHLRISVKREVAGKEIPAGAVSNWLHDHVVVGTVLRVSKPFGDFQPDTESDAPIVLMSAGVGITPMISVLNRIAKVSPTRRVIFAHAARNAGHHPHCDDIALASAAMPNLHVTTFYEEGAESGSVAGRMQLDKLPQWDLQNTNVYMCGPLPFMQEQWAGLIHRNVPLTRLHREVFGPDMLDHLI
jgi:nitric oxide dioxygenase